MPHRSKSNPFAQSPQHWQVTFSLPEIAANGAQHGFDDMVLATSGFETDEKNKIWSFELLFADSPDLAEISRRLMVLTALHGVPTPTPVLKELAQQDWLSLVAQSFPPLAIGRFYVHGAHVKEPAPPGSISIQVDAGAAFGSGEHATTKGCLEAMDWLARRRDFTNVLDMGCGSAILAIASARLWKCPVLASDIDPVAVNVARENTRINRVSGQVTTLVSDGYASDAIGRAAPFDLIVSNILARPLVKLAPAAFANLKRGGVIILSGLLQSQEQQVLSAYIMQGLKLDRRFPHGEWSTLVLK